MENFKDYLERLNALNIADRICHDDMYTDGEIVDKFNALVKESGDWQEILDQRINNNNKIVYRLADGTHFAIDGYYDSQNGSDYSEAEFYEVVPEEKTIIIYPPKQK